jgi:hypothetical protein
MSITGTIAVTHQRGGESVTVQKTITTEAELAADIPVAIGATNVVANVPLDISQIQSILITADQDLTLKTNSSGSPDDTIALKAGIPFHWIKNSGITLPFAADVTNWYVTNASGVATTLKIRALVEATP